MLVKSVVLPLTMWEFWAAIWKDYWRGALDSQKWAVASFGSRDWNASLPKLARRRYTSSFEYDGICMEDWNDLEVLDHINAPK